LSELQSKFSCCKNYSAQGYVMQQVDRTHILQSPFKLPQSEDWSRSLRAIFELILRNHSKLAQATALALANAYRESEETLNEDILLCSKKLWKIAKYIDVVQEHYHNQNFTEAVDTLPIILSLGHELLDTKYFQTNHYQFLIHYLCQNKLQ
jgi:hypothetical protein